ncbi:Butyrophilin subfamily 1 member A1 [Bagarius yarrelli]|uniref:Butyrophilin subfamily 1 member A1 n=1 Tax=Bagarius yarrelli TaxID=175774 RepID=A0A556U021_BAGYA|nr:Butyrophilin subfamily 1 member A1 [Bagarius yarrelli]
MYKNRSSLTLSSPQSNGLKEGDVSLRLDNLGLSDIGIYYCYVSGDKSYDSKTVTLNLTAQGSPIKITLNRHLNSVKLSSTSCGWFPQPSLLWKSTNAPSDLQSTNYTKQENGLFCIYGQVILSSSDPNVINCSVIVSEEEKRSVNMYLEAGLLGYMVVKKPDEYPMSKIPIKLDMSKCKKDYLAFNPDADAVRDTDEAAEKYSPDGFPYELCVSGRNTFSSGRVYWEVELKKPNVPPKKSWLVGVAKASYTISDKKSDLTPFNGFWFLCSDPKNGLHVNTEPEFSPILNKTVECVGVLLDFERNELSFYSATDGVHLFTMIIKFPEEVVPLFNPGLGDKAPLQIINPKVKTSNEC